MIVLKDPQSLDWLDDLFPDKESKVLSDEDVITRKESDIRIIWFLNILSIWLSLAIMGKVIAIGIILIPFEPKLVQPHSPQDLFYRQFLSSHLAIVFQDGSVYDLSLEENISKSKKWILKLPKKAQYHGYSDEKGIIYFLDGDLNSPLIRYHKAINNQGHNTISIKTGKQKKISNHTNGATFISSVLVADKFWLFGGTHVSNLFKGLVTGTAVRYKKW